MIAEGGRCPARRPIIKMGQDAMKAGLLTLKVTADPKARNGRQCEILFERFDLTSKTAPRQAAAQAHYQDIKGRLDALEGFLLYDPSHALSSKNIRKGQSKLGRLVASLMRDYYQADACVISSYDFAGDKQYFDEDEPGFNVGDIKGEFARSKTHYCVAFMTVQQFSEMLAYTQDEARIVRELGLMDSATYMQLDNGIVFDGKAVTALQNFDVQALQSSKGIRVALSSNVVQGDYAVPLVKAMNLNFRVLESEYQQEFWDAIVHANLAKILSSHKFDEWNMDGSASIDAEEFVKKGMDMSLAKKLIKHFDTDGDGMITESEYKQATTNIK